MCWGFLGPQPGFACLQCFGGSDHSSCNDEPCLTGRELKWGGPHDHTQAHPLPLYTAASPGPWPPPALLFWHGGGLGFGFNVLIEHVCTHTLTCHYCWWECTSPPQPTYHHCSQSLDGHRAHQHPKPLPVTRSCTNTAARVKQVKENSEPSLT